MGVTEKKLDQWAKKHELKKLHGALLTYDYKMRLGAIKHLSQIRNRESLTHLEKLIDDPFVSVLKEALEAIRAINPSHPVLANFQKRIAEKEALEQKKRARTETNFQPVSEEEEEEKLRKMAQKYSIRKIEQEGLAEERRQNVNWKVATLIVTVVGGIVFLLYYFYII